MKNNGTKYFLVFVVAARLLHQSQKVKINFLIFKATLAGVDFTSHTGN